MMLCPAKSDRIRKLCSSSVFLLERFIKEHPDRNSAGQSTLLDLHGMVLLWGLLELVDKTAK